MGSPEVERAHAILRAAQQTAGLAAYQYFFIGSTPLARAAYLAALNAETEAQLLVDDIASEMESPALK